MKRAERWSRGGGGGAMAAIVLALSACTSARVSQFKAFAEAGTAYVRAVDAVTEEAAIASIDADSAVLERSRSALDEAQRRETVGDHNELLRKRVEILRDLRRHAHLLEGYFITLGALAGTDAPARAGEAAEELVASMGALSSRIRAARVGEAPIYAFSGAVVEISVARFQRAALERELQARAQVLERELDVQQAAMRAIAAELRADLEIILDHRERVEVTEPYRGSGTLPTSWTRRRREILTATAATGAAEAAVRASAQLKASFVALVEGRLGGPELVALLTDINEVLDLLELVKGNDTSG